MNLLQVIPKPQPPELRLWEYKEVNNYMCFKSRKDIENFTYSMEQVFKYSISLQEYSKTLIRANTKEGKNYE